MKMTRSLGGLGLTLAFLLATVPAFADTTIKWLHLEAVPENVDTWRGIADDYQAAHPGVKIEMQFLENQAFKAKLPTLLQSSDPPSFFYSWSGGILKAQSETGALRDVTAAVTGDPAFKEATLSSVIEGMTFDGKVWCVPYKTGVIGFFYNKALFEKAGVDAGSIKSWDDFLGAVKALKAADITPIAGGGGDKWPIHFYWGYLAMREAGRAGFDAAKAGEGDGFAAAPFVKAGEDLAALGKLEPFQNGWQGATWNDALSTFGDGRAAIILGFENNNQAQAHAATDGKGVPNDGIGRFAFPAVAGAPGLATDDMGGLNCWAVTKNAPPETEDFLKFLASADEQRLLATKTKIIPVNKAAVDAVTDPIVKLSADALAIETWHQNYLDQDLGPSVGGVVNDMAVAIASGQTTPADAAQQIQDTYALEH
ncbi:MAG: ABC transporter substrate-binding protein [Cypionkella sp.]